MVFHFLSIRRDIHSLRLSFPAIARPASLRVIRLQSTCQSPWHTPLPLRRACRSTCGRKYDVFRYLNCFLFLRSPVVFLLSMCVDAPEPTFDSLCYLFTAAVKRKLLFNGGLQDRDFIDSWNSARILVQYSCFLSFFFNVKSPFMVSSCEGGCVRVPIIRSSCLYDTWWRSIKCFSAEDCFHVWTNMKSVICRFSCRLPYWSQSPSRHLIASWQHIQFLCVRDSNCDSNRILSFVVSSFSLERTDAPVTESATCWCFVIHAFKSMPVCACVTFLEMSYTVVNACQFYLASL